MRFWFTIVFLFFLTSGFSQSVYKRLKGGWEIESIVFADDTIYKKSDSKYTFRYLSKLDSTWIRNDEDQKHLSNCYLDT